MKCEYLAKPILPSKGVDIALGMDTRCVRNIVVCLAETPEQCPKKKQPCEINRRCWEMKR